MKKIFILTGLVLLLTMQFVFAKAVKNTMPVIKFDGTKFTLMYSAESKETGGYLNEYYKAHQTYASWTELIGIHHYPTAFYPSEHAKEFAEFLNETGIPANLEVDKENDTALLYFLVIDKRKLPIIIEFNVFKYIKSSVCGTVGFQYARRYRLNSPLEIENAKKDILKTGVKYIKLVSKAKVPEIISLKVDNGKYVLKEACDNNMETLD